MNRLMSLKFMIYIYLIIFIDMSVMTNKVIANSDINAFL